MGIVGKRAGTYLGYPEEMTVLFYWIRRQETTWLKEKSWLIRIHREISKLMF
jgi:hypothetical protein